MKAQAAIEKLHIAERDIPDETIDLIPIKRRVQRWAAANAYTLIFLSVMFFVTWVLLIALITLNVIKGT